MDVVAGVHLDSVDQGLRTVFTRAGALCRAPRGPAHIVEVAAGGALGLRTVRTRPHARLS